MGIKNRIQQEILLPAGQARGTSILAGTITQANERGNVVSVRYVGKDGHVQNKDNVPVKLNDTWFPKEGDIVDIEETGEIVQVIAKNGAMFMQQITDSKLPHDILGDAFNSIVGGYIL